MKPSVIIIILLLFTSSILYSQDNLVNFKFCKTSPESINLTIEHPETYYRNNSPELFRSDLFNRNDHNRMSFLSGKYQFMYKSDYSFNNHSRIIMEKQSCIQSEISSGNNNTYFFGKGHQTKFGKTAYEIYESGSVSPVYEYLGIATSFLLGGFIDYPPMDITLDGETPSYKNNKYRPNQQAFK